ncbi:hypothetical protein VVMO6_01176 [Vibrio vulnificus MO6-24/O]|nr:hypothetical protein VVMO6_01176 [Vibrio vulnificus MO6-24/O]
MYLDRQSKSKMRLPNALLLWVGVLAILCVDFFFGVFVTNDKI